MEDIRVHFNAKNSKLELILPAKNKGKFRWKNRDNSLDYGKGFAAAKTVFTNKAYLEWQIGYDSEVNHDKKTTILDQLEFIGSNHKKKNPYELSEILFLLCENKIVTKTEIIELKNRILASDFSFDETYEISTSSPYQQRIKSFMFEQIDITLPTFSYLYGDNRPSIEISIQKQQYASGVQPMVYLTIPILAFANHEKMIGKSANELTSGALWQVGHDEKDIIFNLFEFFGMCSVRHKHDVVEILNLFIK